MLRARVLTALVLLPVVFGAIYLLSLPAYAAVFGVVVAGAAWEWAALAGISAPFRRLLYMLLVVAAGLGAWFVPAMRLPLLAASGLFWLLAIPVVLRFPSSSALLRPVVVGAAGVLVLPAAWWSLVAIRDHAGPHWLIWLFLLVWAADIGAYFAGRRWGTRKLAPNVSPGKTWEGAAGGAIAAALVAVLPLLATGRWLLVWSAVIVGLIVISIFGDLFESVLKRIRGIKDSGALLPGHGGVLDRVDSLLAVLPFFALWCVAGMMAG